MKDNQLPGIRALWITSAIFEAAFLCDYAGLAIFSSDHLRNHTLKFWEIILIWPLVVGPYLIAKNFEKKFYKREILRAVRSHKLAHGSNFPGLEAAQKDLFARRDFFTKFDSIREIESIIEEIKL